MKENEIRAEDISLAPKIAPAEKEEIKKNVPENSETLTQDTRKVPFEVTELPEKRGANQKVFRMSDGTEKAVFYPENIHVYDEETKRFEKIEEIFVEEEDKRHFRNGKGHFVARFSKEAENDELFSIEKGNHKITVFARKNKKQMNHGVIPTLATKKANKADFPEKNILRFERAIDDSDLEYSVTGSGVKEDIIIKERASVYRYPFLLNCEELSAEYLEQEQRVIFKDKASDAPVFSIPAPFMTDASGAMSEAVSYEFKELAADRFALTVTADSDWVNADERVFPVTIDPQIRVDGNSNIQTYSWAGGTMTAATTDAHEVGVSSETTSNVTKKRMYMSLNIPQMPLNPRIKKAELTIKKKSGWSQETLGVYALTSELKTGNNTPSYSDNLIDFAKLTNDTDTYTFDITNIIDQAARGEITGYSLVLKPIDESLPTNDCFVFYGCKASAALCPTVSITYESSYAINSSYRTHTHEIGRFGQGSVDLQCGNLMFESEDFVWSGNRMPVTIKHLYNSALSNYQYTKNDDIRLNVADFSAMNIGKGWKLNLMQSMAEGTFTVNGVTHTGYIYTNENGEQSYFKGNINRKVSDDTTCYYLFENVDDTELVYDPYKRKINIDKETLCFDDKGRLISITDEYNNTMSITYTSDRISSVTDGAGREFGFSYNLVGRLKSIKAPDNTEITYTYTLGLLTEISYPNGRRAKISYSSSKPESVTLYDTENNQLYEVSYTFNNGMLSEVTEYGSDGSIGASTRYEYSAAANRTIVSVTEQKDTDEDEEFNNTINTVYLFDDDGNIISQYLYTPDVEKVGADGDSAGSGINPYSGDGGAGIVSNIDNLLKQHNFDSITEWKKISANNIGPRIDSFKRKDTAKFGDYVLRISSDTDDGRDRGVYQATKILPAGQYTFSAYIRLFANFSGAASGVFLRVSDTLGNVLGTSERLTEKDSEYTRLILPFTLSEEGAVLVQILMNGEGTIFADGAQLENNPYANAYNMIANSNFENGMDSWVTIVDESLPFVGCSSDEHFNMNNSLKFEQSPWITDAYQDVLVKSDPSVRETFTLSGWAKGIGVPNHHSDDKLAPRFELRAEINYADGTIQTEKAKFSPCVGDWQLSSVQFAKNEYKEVSKIRVYCDFSYNYGTAYFDNIQLIRNSIETGLSASDFTSDSSSSGSSGASSSEISSTQSADDTAPTFEEATDIFGNALTETTFTDGEFGTIYRAFKFNEDNDNITGDDSGNNLIEETDARGNKTSYTVDGDTSRNEEVTDRLGNKTAYEYDDSGRTTKVISKKADGTEVANVSYSYDIFDNMTEIVRGDGMKYVLAYNQFHNLDSIGIEGKDEALIKYTYKNGNGRLKEMKYANGDTMKATYNSIGQMVAETWYNKNGVEIARYKYVYDGEGNIVRSIDIHACKEYNYQYEEGKLIRATESDIVLCNEMITSMTVINTVKYYYDTEGKMTKKVITPTGGSAQTIYYENNDDNTVVKFYVPAPTAEKPDNKQTITAHSKTDSFGRKVFDELQLGTGSVSREFRYHAGEITEEHIENAKGKSSPTTQLVSRIILSDGRTLDYEYDAEERITKVTDSVDGITEYTYDALGQLLTEKVNNVVVNTMTYDNYGNILTKNGKTYTYGNGVWKDLLTSYNGQSITYDAQGNPLTYLGHTLTWEKGRQLKKFVKSDGTIINYTYNANGIRTSKTVSGVKHEYTLDGTKILRETWGDNTLVPLYDNEDGVCGILYNNTPYYFIKNLQGDIIAIVDKDAQTVARYSYDAWGVCTVTQDSVGIATINPFRYRGYYYDEEIGLYYISSRYFDSQTARWLSSDHSTILTYTALPICYSLFTYCCNNPVNNIDLAGYLAFSMAVIVSAAVVGAVFNAISQIAFNYLSGKRGSKIFKGVLGAAVGGAVNSALLLVLWYVPGSNVIAGFIAGFIQSVIDALFDVLVYKTLSWRNFLKECTVNGLWNSAANIAGNYLGGKLVYINKGWFKPKYVASFLKGSYGQRLIAQTGIGAILNLIVNLIRKLFKL